MSKSRVWQSAATLLFATAVSLSFSVGCSKQGEGERCDLDKAGNNDCDDGLACQHTADAQTRCCPPAGAASNDSRCQLGNPVTSSGGSSSTGGSTSAGGNSSGGSTNTSGGAPEAGAENASGGASAGAGN